MTSEELITNIEVLETDIRNDWLNRVKNYPVDLFEPTVNKVVTGLLARQATLAIQLLLSPNTWNQHSAPLFHRAMADIHITLAYILEADTDKRAKEYVLYGLGQEKLSIAHYEQLLSEENDPRVEEIVEARKAWLNSQRYEFLTEVNLGSHTGISTYAMAEQSGNKDLYNFNFTPFSAAVHSTWQHIAQFNLEICPDPLHGGHLISTIPDLPNDWFEVWLAVKNLSKTLLLVDDFMGLKEEVNSWHRIKAILDQKDVTNSPESENL